MAVVPYRVRRRAHIVCYATGGDEAGSGSDVSSAATERGDVHPSWRCWRDRGSLCATVVTLVALSICATALGAQGVNTASISGVVRALGGGDIDGARVRVVNQATGYPTETTVRGGFFNVPGLEAGVPYSVVVRRIGFAPIERRGIYLALGERRVLQLMFEAAVLRLDTVLITPDVAYARSAAAGGVGTWISDSALRRLPTLNADLYDFLRLAPQTGARFGPSGGGANFRLNNFVIDGVSDRPLQNNGPSNAARSTPLDAVNGYQVLLSPFDVRYGDFIGLLVNSVTKSGTNVLHGSAYGSMRNATLARSGSFLGTSAFDREAYGFSLGGPIVRDRFHFFVASELQRAMQPARGPYVGQSATASAKVPVSADSIARFASLLSGYGVKPGDGGRVMLPNPNAMVFGRVDLALPELRSRAVIRANYSRTDQTQFERRDNTRVFQLSSNASAVRMIKQTTAVQIFTQLSGSTFNELDVGHTDSPISSVPYTLAPSIQVKVGAGSEIATLTAGPSAGGTGGASQIATELGDHLAISVGVNHTIEIGAHVELFRYHITGFRNRLGQWIFPNLDSLAHGAASSYTIGKDFGSAESPVIGAEPTVYVSDDWRLGDDLSLMLGLRMDGWTFSGHPDYNPDVDVLFHRRTDDYPSFRPEWSPRVGFIWTPDPDHATSLHGGAGIFVGRPPIGWLVGPMRSNGAGVKTLTCAGAIVPAFAPYPAPQPATCTNGKGPSNGPVTLVDRNLRMAQSFRASLALDRRLRWGVTGGVEALYSRTRSDFVFSNMNLRGPVGVDANGRVMYGTITGGVAQPALVGSPAFSEVVDLRNQSGGSAWSVTGRLDKPWSDHLEGHAAYTYSRVRDVQSLVNSGVVMPLDIWASERPISGRWDDQSTGISAFEIRHRVVVAATYVARWKRRATDISLYYVGESGTPFTYGDSTAGGGDLNADGTAANDPIYVPRNATDRSEIVFSGTDSTAAAQDTAFERFIRGTPCLRRQRGRIMGRNSCNGPWVHTSNLSIRQSLPALGGHAASLQLEVFNVLNLLNSKWGLYAAPNPWLLQYAGQTAGATPQHIFSFNPATTRSVLNAESSYQLQLSLRYTF